MTRIARISSAVAVVLGLLGATVSPARAQTLAREKLQNDIGFELLGKSIAYSFLYQYTVNRYVAFDAGFGALGGGSGNDVATLVFIPMGVRLYAIPQNGTFFVSGGGVLANASSSNGPFSDESSSGSYGYVGPGFEFRAETGFTFRGTAYGLVSDGGFFIWPGLTVGYAF